MYKISVPIMNSNTPREEWETIYAQIKRFDAERVFLALDCYQLDPVKREKAIRSLKENCDYFRSKGLEVGAWIWAFMLPENRDFRCMRTIAGDDVPDTMCPTDPAFMEFAREYIRDIACCGVDIIMFDDDLRYGFRGDSPSCLCDGHMERIRSITGMDISRQEVEKYILTGGRNPVRDAYLKANGDVLREFAAAMRDAVDAVDPAIRLGACACMSSWDIDGVDAAELARILAGGTQPFVRLIGAPYWAALRGWGNELQDVVELERMESAWTRFEGLEIMAEGDVYPRPRTKCPASYLEGYDMAIRASGCTDGILKYGIDYWSRPGYETGYARCHERNRDLYRGIDRLFHGEECGVRVYEYPQKIADMVVPMKTVEKRDIQDLFFSKAARTLAYNTVPAVYEGEGVCGIVFGENARHIPLSALLGGMILDIAAAEILESRGVDTGMAGIGSLVANGECECFCESGERIYAYGSRVWGLELRPGAEVLSYMPVSGGEIPVTYRYENAAGQRFLVLNIDTVSTNDNLFKHYARSAQYAAQIPWLSGKKLPAHVYGHPALYIQCRRTEDTMTVGLWNSFADIAMEPEVVLDSAYADAEFLGCSGRLEGDRVVLSDIPAFGFAAFVVRGRI